MDWFKISDAPGTDYTRVTVDVPHEQLADVIDAVRACAPAVERPRQAEGSSPEPWVKVVDKVEAHPAVFPDGCVQFRDAGLDCWCFEVQGRTPDPDQAAGGRDDDRDVVRVGAPYPERYGSPLGDAGAGDLDEAGEGEGGVGLTAWVAEHREAVDEKSVHGGSSSRCGRGAGESAPAAGVGVGTPEPMSEGVGGEGAAVISVAFSVPRGGPGADMRWPAPQITALSLCDLIGETLADLRAALAEEAEAAEGGEGR